MQTSGFWFAKWINECCKVAWTWACTSCQSILTPIHTKVNLQAICSCYFVGPCLVWSCSTSSVLVLNFSLHLLHLNFFLLKNSNFILRLFTAIDIKSSTNQVLFPLVSFAGNNNNYSSMMIIGIYYYHN